MENLHIPATKSSPEIHFNSDTHLLELTGESYPENIAEFYRPVFSWMTTYLNMLDSAQASTFTIELLYCNSSSSKVLLDLLYLLDDASRQGKMITINWMYNPEVESALEVGKEFREDIESLTFNLVPQTIYNDNF